MSRNRTITYLMLATMAGVWIAQAGSLEPPGPPAPTMKPLTDIPSSWRDLITPAARFELVMGDLAVLDLETGLVWEQAPLDGAFPWFGAVLYCYGLELGGRQGWRLPAIEEFSAIIDPSQSSPALPPGHPFSRLRSGIFDYYWTITNHPLDQGHDAIQIGLASGVLNHNDKELGSGFAWCVRGGVGHNPDAYVP